MMTLLGLPDELLLGSILQYLTAADLWRLGATCHRLNKKDPEKNAVQKELKERDMALIQSKQYPPESAIMSVFDYRERIFCFERCSAFAWEMTRQEQRHNSRCKVPGCTYPDLHAWLPKLANGVRGGKYYFFFALFTSKDKILWQGFLQDYDPESDFSCPMDDLLRTPDEESNAITDAFGAEGLNTYLDLVEKSDVEFHLDTGNVSNLTTDHMDPDWHVTLVSLIYSQKQPELQPELKLHYSCKGFDDHYPKTPSPNHDGPFMHILYDPYVTPHDWASGEYATPYILWKSRDRLHSFSMLYHLHDESDDDYYEIFAYDAMYDDEMDYDDIR